MDKNLISEDLRKEFLFRKGWSGGSYMHLLLTEIISFIAAKRLQEPWDQGVLIGIQFLFVFFGGSPHM